MDDTQSSKTEVTPIVREIGVVVGDTERLLSLKIHMAQEDNSGALQLELSDPANAAFLMYCVIHADEYENIITSQNVFIPFSEFPSHFVSIVDKILESKTSISSSLGGLFTFSICLDPVEGGDKQLLKVIQVSSFMKFPLITLPFQRANESQLIAYLLSLVDLYQGDDVGESLSQLSRPGSILKRYQDLQKQYTQDTSRMKQEYESSLSQVQQAMETQINSLKQQIDTLEEQHNSSLQEQHSQWSEQLEKTQNELNETHTKLLSMQNERDEVTESLSVLQEELRRVKQLADEGVSFKESLANMEAQTKNLTERYEQTQLQLTQHTQRAEQLTADLAQCTAQRQEAVEHAKELEATIQQLHQTIAELEEREATSQKLLEEQKGLAEALSTQVAQLKVDCGKYAENVKALSHSNKIKDRAISCLNQEINKMKLGSHFTSSL